MIELAICYCVTIMCASQLYSNWVTRNKDFSMIQEKINESLSVQIDDLREKFDNLKFDDPPCLEQIEKRLEDLEKTNKRVDALVLKAGFKV